MTYQPARGRPRPGAAALVLPRPPAWMSDGLCAQTDPEAFFPEKGESARPAKKVCARCPVQAPCLAYALAHREPHGIWGGLTGRERRDLLRNRQAAA
jgi:WhiB family redox-sensing transcriptional regulator